MGKGKVFAIAAAALVAGLVLGSLSLASAAPAGNAGAGDGAGSCGGRAFAAGSTLADIVAKLTGRTVADVRADRQAGKSFAEIAKAKNVSADKVVGDTLAARKAALDAAVKDGRITQAQADTMYANMKANLTNKVSSTTAGCNGAGPGSGGGRGRMGGGGCGGGGCLGQQ